MFRNSQTELELKFEKYLKDKASTDPGKTWLSDFKKDGLTTIILVMHFIYDRKWTTVTFDEKEEERIFYTLSKVKQRVYKELSL